MYYIYVLCVCIVNHGHDGDYTTMSYNFFNQLLFLFSNAVDSQAIPKKKEI